MSNYDLLSFRDGLREITNRVEKMGSPILVVISGGTCSGKTYLANFLAGYLLSKEILSALIPLDAYYKDVDDPTLPKNEKGQLLFDVPGSYRQVEYRQDVLSLLNGKSIRLPCYDICRNRIEPKENELLNPQQIIIAEGLFAIRIIQNCWPRLINVYVEAGVDLMLERRITRDVGSFNVSAKKVKEFFDARVLPYHQKFVVPQRDLAEIIIRGMKEVIVYER